MPAYGDPRILNAQLQSVLDAANKTFSESQTQILESEIQRAMRNAAAEASGSWKGKASRCDGINCDTVPSSIRPHIRASESEIPTELLAGKLLCEICSPSVALRDQSGFNLAPWLAHLLVCGQQRDYNVPQDSTVSKDISRPSSQSLFSTYASPTTNNAPVLSELIPIALYPSDTKIQSSSPPPEDLSNERTDIVSSMALTNSQGDENSTALILDMTDAIGSVPKKRRGPNRSEAERMEEFLTDPSVAQVEPYRVLCAICDKWIKLRKNSRYCPIPWNCHKDSCERSNGPPGQSLVVPISDSKADESHSTAQAPSSTPIHSQVPNSSITHPSLSASLRTDTNLPPPNTHPSLLRHANISTSLSMRTVSTTAKRGSHSSHNKPRQSHRTRVADAEQRRAALEADPHSEVVECDRILCSLCRKWVKLRPNSAYCSAPWQSHIRRCIIRNQSDGPQISSSDMAPPMKTTHAPEDSLTGDSQMKAGNNVTVRLESDTSNNNYYRKNYNDSLVSGFVANQPITSHYKTPLPLVPASSTLQGKRRGRPPKKKALAPKPEKSDSEMSYESEEA